MLEPGQQEVEVAVGERVGEARRAQRLGPVATSLEARTIAPTSSRTVRMRVRDCSRPVLNGGRCRPGRRRRPARGAAREVVGEDDAPHGTPQ